MDIPEPNVRRCLSFCPLSVSLTDKKPIPRRSVILRTEYCSTFWRLGSQRIPSTTGWKWVQMTVHGNFLEVYFSAFGGRKVVMADERIPVGAGSRLGLSVWCVACLSRRRKGCISSLFRTNLGWVPESQASASKGKIIRFRGPKYRKLVKLLFLWAPSYMRPIVFSLSPVSFAAAGASSRVLQMPGAWIGYGFSNPNAANMRSLG